MLKRRVAWKQTTRSATFSAELRRMQNKDLETEEFQNNVGDLLSSIPELQAPISDSAFYLSYYYDVARAPSLLDGLRRLLSDDRSEAPEVVNALQKFNVAPELFAASLHRLGLGPSAFGAYVWVLISFNGAGCAALVFTAFLMGGGFSGLVCGSLYAALCFGGTQAGTRLGGASMALREHWGVPALLLQNLFLSALVLQPGAAGLRHRWLRLMLAAGTAILELSWQFAPFLLLLQLLAALGAHVLGALPRTRLGEIALAQVLGTAVTLAVSFGNRMLLCSPFLALAASTSVVCLTPLPSFLQTGSRVAAGPHVIEAVWVLLAALLLGAATHQSLAVLAANEEDRHILQLLAQKLGLSPPEASFDAFLYLQAPEFQFLTTGHVMEAAASGALPSAAVSAVLLLIGVARSRLCSRSELCREEAAWILQALFAVALCLLAFLVSRLRVLAAPLLALVGALCASPALLGFAIGRRLWLLPLGLQALLVVAPLWYSNVLDRVKEVGPLGEDGDMRDLVAWANSSLPPSALLLADMTLAAKLRLTCPQIRVGNHPQYESLTSRKRNRDYYRTFTCASPATVHQVIAPYGVTHLVLNANACRARVGKLDAFVDESDRCGAAKGAALLRRSFCSGGFTAGAGLFEVVYWNAIYIVLRVGAAGGRKASQPVDLLQVTGTLAARGLAQAAYRWKGGLQASEHQLQRALELAPEDPLVVLAAATASGRPSWDELARAADLAAGAPLAERAPRVSENPAALFQVYLSFKGLLNQRGPQAAKRLANLAKALAPYLEATYNSFDLCDIAGWLKDWGETALARKLWRRAARDPFDACVREDWEKWEGSPPTTFEIWRAFFRLQVEPQTREKWPSVHETYWDLLRHLQKERVDVHKATDKTYSKKVTYYCLACVKQQEGLALLGKEPAQPAQDAQADRQHGMKTEATSERGACDAVVLAGGSIGAYPSRSPTPQLH
ncbi:Dpy19l3 [Symbiodinium natans]|uniref:Dpy19l3 protein n=1 Tax=Symbiodinium natans TaxID=878477 RepID=A0A812JZC6_9DINO|nr:Dpy19l3 [Symbiodinium natans]